MGIFCEKMTFIRVKTMYSDFYIYYLYGELITECLRNIDIVSLSLSVYHDTQMFFVSNINGFCAMGLGHWDRTVCLV